GAVDRRAAAGRGREALRARRRQARRRLPAGRFRGGAGWRGARPAREGGAEMTDPGTRSGLPADGPRLEVSEVGAATVAELAGGVIATERDATDVGANASFLGADHVLLGAEQRGPGFVEPGGGLAAARTEKFVNYPVRLVGVGGLRGAGSASWRACAREGNGGGQLWFAPDRPAALERIRGGGAA